MINPLFSFSLLITSQIITFLFNFSSKPQTAIICEFLNLRAYGQICHKKPSVVCYKDRIVFMSPHIFLSSSKAKIIVIAAPNCLQKNSKCDPAALCLSHLPHLIETAKIVKDRKISLNLSQKTEILDLSHIIMEHLTAEGEKY